MRPTSLAIRFLDGDAAPVDIAYAALDARSRALAARLHGLVPRGGRAMLLLPSGIDYAVAFYACLYAGVIAVPAYPPGSSRVSQDQRLRGMMLDARPAVILTTRLLFPAIEAWGAAGDAPLLAVEDVAPVAPSGWRPVMADPAAIAFLQYTSGSTARPKGVCVTHANLLANEAAMAAAFGATPEDVSVSWLPFYHDMGLIGGLLLPLYVGFSVTLMSPQRFLERPRRWLEAISHAGATISGGPDFAFRLAAERVPDAALGNLDLHRWRVAFSGSEPVRAATLDRFAQRFAPTGFDARALNPCYGLAEATLFVTGGRAMTGARIISLDPAALGRGEALPAEDGLRSVGCGEVRTDHALRIVIDDVPVADGVIGDIQVAGPSLAQGYWHNEAASQAAFFEEAGRRWLRTGDLGFLSDGALHVTGRRKDILIIRGQNIYPQDVEQVIEEAFEPARRGRIAVFPVEAQGREAIGVAVEIGPLARRKTGPAALAEAIGRIVLRHCDEFPALVALLPPHAMPMTTSGKLQRSACAAGLADGTLDAFAVLESGKLREPPATMPGTAVLDVVAAMWCQALERDQVAPEDDFFMLGGSSIGVAEVAAAIQDRFGIAIDARLLFELPRLGDFAAKLASLLAAAGPSACAPAALPPGTALPLSHAQERLWFLWRMEPAGTAYNVAAAIRLTGDLDPARLQDALVQVIRRHAVLRTTFHAGEDRPRQQVRDDAALILRRWELPFAVEDRAPALAAQIEAELAVPFDLAAGPLLRAELLRFAADDHALLLAAHHIVVDGLSMEVLLGDLAAFYRAPEAGNPPLPIQFGDHAAWQRDWLRAGEQDRQLAYWRATLGDRHPVLTLPLDRPRPATQSHRGAVLHQRLAPALVAALGRVAAQHRATLPMLLLSAYQLLLHRYSGQEEVRIGIPVANRQHAAAARLIGCFVNTLVFPGRLDGAARFTDLLARSRRLMLDALAHQDLPFDALVDALQVPRSLAHNPLFQAKFNYMAAPAAIDLAAGLRAEMQQPAQGGAHFDLALDVTQDEAGLDLAFQYAVDILGPKTVGRMAADLAALLHALAAEADLPLQALPWPDTAPVPAEAQAFPQATLLPLLAAAAAGRASLPAVDDGQVRLSHGALWARSGAIAGWLAARGVGAEARIGICADRDAGFVTALLGVLKAGAAYVPLDASWPAARLAQVAAAAGLVQVLADGAGLAALQAAGIPATALADPALLAGQAEAPPAVDPHPGQTAYVIYTSGSTGQPKGVAVSHGALANYVQAMLDRLQPPAGAMAMVSTPAADLGHTVLFGALASGATLHLLDAATTGDAEAFARRMREGA
ncbi:AMP-binding protein, partial [Plastoroseomonas hellenica]|uniref:AMP-binding protein n=1 Tax=Plastoroseomonas hellenica TaxID=2687306 RepID=UPI001BAD5DB4